MAKEKNLTEPAEESAINQAPAVGSWVKVKHAHGTNELFYKGTDSKGIALFSKKNTAGFEMKAAFTLLDIESIEVI